MLLYATLYSVHTSIIQGPHQSCSFKKRGTLSLAQMILQHVHNCVSSSDTATSEGPHTRISREGGSSICFDTGINKLNSIQIDWLGCVDKIEN